MNLKTLATTSIALCFVAGAAFAQATGTAEKGGSGTNLAPFASEQEKAMYEDNKDMLSGFFTDDTMTTLKSDEEIQGAFAAMDAEGQAGMKAACEKAYEDRGQYGAVTTSLCDHVTKM